MKKENEEKKKHHLGIAQVYIRLNTAMLYKKQLKCGI